MTLAFNVALNVIISQKFTNVGPTNVECYKGRTVQTFVLVQSLYQSDVFTSPTFVLVLTFLLTDVCKS